MSDVGAQRLVTAASAVEIPGLLSPAQRVLTALRGFVLEYVGGGGDGAAELLR